MRQPRARHRASATWCRRNRSAHAAAQNCLVDEHDPSPRATDAQTCALAVTRRVRGAAHKSPQAEAVLRKCQDEACPIDEPVTT
eukprot:5424746-Pleurochrysis_carterae.AAC.1